MKDIFFISDTHFNHEAILQFVDHAKPTELIRAGFENIEHMNETMIERWNSVVKPTDVVYHLGDVVFGENKPDWLETNMPRLNGKKFLVLGNHDRPKILQPYFKEISVWAEFHDHNFIATHIPMHKEATKRGRPGYSLADPKVNYMRNVHGHIHQNKSWESWMKCVSVEQTDYTPVHIEELFV